MTPIMSPKIKEPSIRITSVSIDVSSFTFSKLSQVFLYCSVITGVDNRVASGYNLHFVAVAQKCYAADDRFPEHREILESKI